MMKIIFIPCIKKRKILIPLKVRFILNALSIKTQIDFQSIIIIINNWFVKLISSKKKQYKFNNKSKLIFT